MGMKGCNIKLNHQESGNILGYRQLQGTYLKKAILDTDAMVDGGCATTFDGESWLWAGAEVGDAGCVAGCLLYTFRLH